MVHPQKVEFGHITTPQQVPQDDTRACVTRAGGRVLNQKSVDEGAPSPWGAGEEEVRGLRIDTGMYVWMTHVQGIPISTYNIL